MGGVGFVGGVSDCHSQCFFSPCRCIYLAAASVHSAVPVDQVLQRDDCSSQPLHYRRHAAITGCSACWSLLLRCSLFVSVSAPPISPRTSETVKNLHENLLLSSECSGETAITVLFPLGQLDNRITQSHSDGYCPGMFHVRLPAINISISC